MPCKKEIVKDATAQAKPRAGRGGVVPPKSRQFGQPNGNRRNPSGWKKEDTARFKLERMLEMSEAQLHDILENHDAPLFERRIARSLLSENGWKTTESMINQVYGTPRQTVEHEIAEPKPLIDLTDLFVKQDEARESAKEPAKTAKKTTKIIKKCTKKAKTAKTAPKTEKKARKTAKKATEAPVKDETQKNG